MCNLIQLRVVYFVFTKNELPVEKVIPTVILISLDGFRWDYLDMYKANTPVLNRLRGEGFYSAIQPMFPTKTFPNHYTIVTGLYPESHGIISNTFYDPVFNATFTLSNGEALQARWWGGEPLWVSVQKKGLKSGIYFWPGSEAPIQGVYPTFYKAYDKSVPMGTRADGVIQWLEMPEGERPHFLALYMEAVDDADYYGPFSPNVGIAAGVIDTAIGRLMDYLYESGKFNTTNLVILADHGMALLDNSRVILLDRCIDMSLVTVIDWSPNCYIIPKDNSSTPALMDALARCKAEQYPNMTAYLKEDVPARLHFNNNRRITPILIIADLGWSVTTTPSGNYDNTGNHGFDNVNKDMWGLFLAHGPNIKEEVTLDKVPNLEVYNFITHVLGVPAAPNNGTSFLIDNIYEAYPTTQIITLAPL